MRDSHPSTALVAALVVLLAFASPCPARAQNNGEMRMLEQQWGQLFSQGRYAEAAAMAPRLLAAAEQAYGSSSAAFATKLNNAGILYYRMGRYAEAEPLYKRSIAITEKVQGGNHPELASVLNNLGMLCYDQGRYRDAEALHNRAFTIREKSLGPAHTDLAQSANNLALVYEITKRYPDAERFFQRSVAIVEKAQGRESTMLAPSLNGLARVYSEMRRFPEAEALLKRSIAIRTKALGPNHPDVATSMHNLALIYQAQGKFAEAKAFYKRDLSINIEKLGPDHPVVAIASANLASLYMSQRDWRSAAEAFRKSAAIGVSRAQRGLDDVGMAQSGRQDGAGAQSSDHFVGFIKAANQMGAAAPSETPALARETFAVAQWATSSGAAQSLAQMAARGARGDPALEAVARQRQDLVAEWSKRDQARTSALAAPPERRNQAAMSANDARLAAIDEEIARIDRRLAAEFPDYAALARPGALATEDAQAQLRPDEALVLFLDTSAWKTTPEETFIWVVTKTDVLWARSDLGSASLAREVQALRCGLDARAWEDDGGKKCREALGASSSAATASYDLDRAYRLYKSLFGQAEKLISGKSLLVVPAGPLTQLPFHTLVAGPVSGASYKSAPWLARKHAVTILPAVSSLKALRRTARPTASNKPLVGFGNPLLDGNPADPDERKLAQQARDNQFCRKAAPQAVDLAFVHRGGLRALQTRGGLVDTAQLRSLTPLPETADELCAVARDLHADPSELYLGARAAEREVKALSQSGRLAKYRIVHFATHGALAGQIDAGAEPGLILTPPAAATPEDDGYLTASEIAALKLDADWVILSACNTAAGGASGAEALSGLARAFFYAQARALLVSHWEVNSLATVKLITSAASTLAEDKTAGRAEAMRRAMLNLIDNGTDQEAHPSYWAPFVVVGEGGR